MEDIKIIRWKFLNQKIQCVCIKSPQLCLTFCDPMDYSFLCPWDSPGKNPGVGCCVPFQGSFWPRDRTHVSYVSCIGKWLVHQHLLESPGHTIAGVKNKWRGQRKESVTWKREQKKSPSLNHTEKIHLKRNQVIETYATMEL